MRNTPQNWIRRTGASLFFAGYIPLAPGTVGSALVVGALWYVHRRFGVPDFPRDAVPFWACGMALIALSIALSGNAVNVFGDVDPRPVIIDECAGQFLTFFLVPVTWRTLLLGFLLFRLYDIVKPFPVYAVEEIEGGTGITLDDVAAGVMANLSLLIILWGYHAVRAFLA